MKLPLKYESLPPPISIWTSHLIQLGSGMREGLGKGTYSGKKIFCWAGCLLMVYLSLKDCFFVLMAKIDIKIAESKQPT